MAEFELRNAGPDDVVPVVAMIRRMVADMASHGGHAPADDGTSWEKVTAGIAEDLASPRRKFIVAQSGAGERLGVAGGNLVTLGGAFAPKEMLHISVVYVAPQFRRAGIARMLVTALLDWGRASGAVECDLHVLNRNPARELYEQLGFATAELKMTKPLRAAPDSHRAG
jgi:ribosomal protein S18 acetylase RimI-like enzyme